ncbi:hemagglutinin repeat-containing protein [Trabulsiella odontotermitis]|uniref:hemagglutinin repeat-containing protein n=1 Tax=Trabulsiella odontotermitis TaxID=379893 RepID=UPI0024B66F47|nr:hemagglutinin repeat-containing protein [Trabulsiella odontotermitis]WHP32246.1 hemagglutinin repeat-containing protein [Trabulsiella odontotermitis]
MDNNQTRFSQRVLSWLLSTLLATQPFLPAVAATITPTGNTKMDKAGNGVPVVNIATPNGAGISHNKYNNYNVGKEGLILNNATGKLNQTQLGGLIQNNPNLKAGQEARGIINEVTSANRSQLQGYTEVAGKAANVIVANPYGITCNGCGFINTPNVTLTTGKPVLDASGNLQSFDVTKGSITIEGQGLDGSLSDSVSILTRATDINAALHAKDLTVIAGANRVTADGRVSALKGEGEVPKVAIDTGALGGMYANRIQLVSGESGVGVNLGNLNARSGDITLDTNGRLTVNNSLATGAITAKGQSVTLAGDHKAGGNLTVSSQSDIALGNGSLNSDNDLSLTASGKITQQNEKLIAGRDATLRATTLSQDGNSQTDAARNIALNAGSSVATQGRVTAGQNLSVTTGTLSHSGELVAGNALSLNATNQTLSGAVNATGDITVQGQNLSTTTASQIQGRNLTLNAKQATLGGTQAAKSQLKITASERLTHSGKSSAEALNINAPALINQGVMTATTLNTQSQTLTNSGLLQGDSQLLLNTRQLDNQQAGTLYSAANLTLSIPDIVNNGLISGDAALTVQTTTLTGDGLLQGVSALTLAGDTLTQGTAGRWLTAGALDITAGQLTTTGTLQGENVTLNGTGWNHSGSLLATGNLSATLASQFVNSGDIMSQSNAILTAQSTDNQGQVLSAGNLTLAGTTLNNRTTGSLLTAGDLNASTSTINNQGQWQGKRVLTDALSLTNGGIIQASESMSVRLTGNLTGAAGSKLISNGEMALSALNLSNSGQWIAQNLTLSGDTLTNAGDITGVSGLAVSLNGMLTNQTGGKMLSAGALALQAAGISNAGQLQGKATTVNAASLANSGRVQGESLDLNISGELNNAVNGVLLSQNALSLSTATLINNGTLQGGGATTLTASTRAQNDGNILSGGRLTLTTPQLTTGSNGLIQALTLLVNAVQTVNGGKIVATGDAELRGTSLTNTGTLQGANLQVLNNTLTNSGTVLGTSSLTVKSATVNNQADGKLFSAGDLLLDSNTLTSAGQVVALGDTTLKLVSALTHSGTLAAGNLLSVTSQGAITSNGVMQGNGLLLSAGGVLTNNGQLTTGTASSTFNAQSILLNDAGSLSAGGDVQMTSRSDITVNGFLGTAGNMTMNAAGTLLNTALIYAGNNLQLFADRIHNIYGDILAGNSLVMQKNAAGAANTEIINTSGNIETLRGDITMKTGHLLNQRDGLKVTETHINGGQAIPGIGDATVNIDISNLAEGSYGMTSEVVERQVGSCNGHGACNYIHWNQFYYAMFTDSAVQKFIANQTRLDVTSTGGVAQIASGNNLTIAAGTLENQASNILANGNIILTGNVLNNQSWQSGTATEWYVYQYDPGRIGYAVDPETGYPTDGNKYSDVMPDSNTIAFTLVGHDTSRENGDIYRSVIQAGGNVNATFTSDISNTSATASAGQISNAITTPSLTPLSQQAVSDAEQTQSLTDADTVAVNSPEWRDEVNEALQNLTGGDSLDNSATGAYPLPSGNNGYFVTSTDPDSPYLITVNPKLDGLGQLDPSLYGDLYALLGMQPGDAPRETNSAFTDQNQFLGSSYFLDRLGLNPDNDYRFLGDAAFDTRYVSNYILNQTGSRYINGLGSDLDQMRYLIDNAAATQSALGLQFGVALTAAQIAALDQSILWWESATINGQTVMLPKVYLSPKDVVVQIGSVISGNNIQLAGGTVINDGSTITAQNALAIDSSNSLSNLNTGLINAGGNLSLSALGDINNIGSAISGRTVQLESVTGSINNITQTQQWDVNAKGRTGNVHISGTDVGPTASITAKDSLDLYAGKDINVTGANVAAGGDLTMAAEGNINVTANEIAEHKSRTGFRGKGDINNSSVSQQGSSITAGGNLAMQAGNDLNVSASSVSAGESALLAAGNDLNLNAAREGETQRNGKAESHESHAAVSTVTAGDNLTLAAGRDVNSQAAGIAAENNVALQAGRDMNLMAESASQGNSYMSKNKKEINESVRQQSTEILSGGDTVMVAGRDITSEASSATAGGDIALVAGRDVTLTTATESDYHYKEEKKTSGGFLSKKTTHTIEEDSATREKGSLLSGNSVTVSAGNDLKVKGSDVVADQDVALAAGNNVEITAATNTDTSWRFKEEKKSGLMGTGGIGFTIGSSKTTHDRREAGTTQSQSASTVGSTGGNVSITAGNQVHISGSDVIANRDISITGDSVVIDPGHDRRTVDERFEQKSTGITVALSGAVGSALNQAVSAAQDAKNSSDSRLGALKGTQAILSGVQAGANYGLQQQSADPNNGIGVSISLNHQQSKSETKYQHDMVSGSTLSAGNNVSITATGKNKDQNNSGDILIAGSQIKSGNDTTLNAQNDILLAAAANTQQTTGKNSSKGGGVGVSFGGGTNGGGLSIFASINGSKGSEKGNGTTWTETTLDAGKNISLTSGRDTTLSGAQVSGEKVTADVGNNLTISSLQDSDRYDSKQNSVAAGGSFTFGGGGGSAYASISQDKIKSNYDSVQEQSGIYAGKGGFDVTVGNHTQLDGAVIASTATDDKNRLDTGTLGWTDIHNEADYKTSHTGISVSGGSGMSGSQMVASNAMANAANALTGLSGSKGHAEGTTSSAISGGSIVIRDKENQKQDVADLSRDPENANGSIAPIFDKEKEQQRLQQAQVISQIGGQMSNIVMTLGETEAMQKARDKHPGLSDEQLRNTQDYKDVMKGYGTGSTSQMVVQAITGVLGGLNADNFGQALAGGLNPAVAQLIKQTTGDNQEANLMAHAVWGALAAQLGGNNAAAGAAGAFSGELAAQYIINNYYGGKTDNLSEQERQQISMLATIASGVAGGLAGNSAAAGTGAQAGKNAVENNSLSEEEEKRLGLRPGKIIDINPLFNSTAKVLDGDGDPLKGGGGGAKFSINKGQQNKHVPGTNEFKIASEAGLNKSTLSVSPDSLLPKLGTGQQVGNVPVGTPGSKERINYGKPIGNYIDPQTGISIPTTNGIVHYGKNGVHIVPARPSEK